MVAQVLEATPALDASGNITWTLCDKVGGGCGSGNGHYPTINLPVGSGSTPFTITINDKDHLGVTFANNPNDKYASVDANGAIWMQQGGGCPTVSTFDTGGQVPSVNKPTPIKIMFVDANSENGPLSLGYTLNFVRNGKAVTSIDPIINNGGCCQMPATGGRTYSTEVIVGVALVAIVLVVLAVRLYQRRNAPGE